MNVDILVAEIGSTITKVNAFQGFQTAAPEFVGQGQAPTSVLDGDVRIGLEAAIQDLAFKLGEEHIRYTDMLATSSAAGGLKMTVHGLVYNMTARAAKEAALGAGAIVHKVTAGKLRPTDLEQIRTIQPNILLIAGGVDYGERETAVYNAKRIAELQLGIPVIYAGNVENRDEIRAIFDQTSYLLHVIENVYPRIDELRIEPARRVIQDVFEDHIIHAPGMEHIRELVNGPIVPTPGAVMELAKLLYGVIGDLVVVDVGGATTDIHSVTEGSEEINRILINPEPIAKRTVEGDLGVYVNMPNLVALLGRNALAQTLSTDLEECIETHAPVPQTTAQIEFVEALTWTAIIKALERHAGHLRTLHTTSGMKTLAEGKDLSQVKYLIGTGGALTGLPHRVQLLNAILERSSSNSQLLPQKTAKILIDHNYILASLGVLSKTYPDTAIALAGNSLRIDH